MTWLKQFSVQGPETGRAEARSIQKDYFRTFCKINSCWRPQHCPAPLTTQPFSILPVFKQASRVCQVVCEHLALLAVSSWWRMGDSREFKHASGRECTWDNYWENSPLLLSLGSCVLSFPILPFPIFCSSFALSVPLPQQGLSLSLIFTDTPPDAMGGGEAQRGVQCGRLTWKWLWVHMPFKEQALTPSLWHLIPSFSGSLLHTCWVQNHIIRWVNTWPRVNVKDVGTMWQIHRKSQGGVGRDKLGVWD